MSDDARAPQTSSTGRRDSDQNMTRAIEALERAVDALTKTVETLDRAIFGRWDETQNKNIPGLQERLTNMERLLKRVIWAGSVVASVLLLRAIGVPTDEIGKLVTLLLSHTGS